MDRPLRHILQLACPDACPAEITAAVIAVLDLIDGCNPYVRVHGDRLEVVTDHMGSVDIYEPDHLPGVHFKSEMVPPVDDNLCRSLLA